MAIESVEKNIWNALVGILDTLKIGGSNVDAFARAVNTEVIKLLSSDFTRDELPVIQMYDLGESCISEQQGTKRCDWRVRIEIAIKKTSTTEINQGELRRYKHIVERAIGSNVQLGVRGVYKVDYVGGITDAHILDDLYIAQLDFVVDYFKNYTKDC